MGIGTASVIHHENIQARTPNMFLLLTGPSSFTNRHMRAQSRGPNMMKKLLGVKRDMKDLQFVLFSVIPSWIGSKNGALRSSETP